MNRFRAPRRAWPALLLLLACTALPWPVSSASASCVAPLLGVDGSAIPPRHPVSVRAGDDLTVRGRFFHHGCNDTGGSETDAFGCSHSAPREAEPPMKHVVLRITQRGHTWRLGVADADGRSAISWDVTVPDGLRPGAATLRAGTSSPLRVVVR
ncbi:MAG TPA: hypothetical protein VFL69_14790 [Marmoricola sp.]|nr:hypothetical protein [Marmoricola sp.]